MVNITHEDVKSFINCLIDFIDGEIFLIQYNPELKNGIKFNDLDLDQNKNIKLFTLVFCQYDNETQRIFDFNVNHLNEIQMREACLNMGENNPLILFEDFYGNNLEIIQRLEEINPYE